MADDPFWIDLRKQGEAAIRELCAQRRAEVPYVQGKAPRARVNAGPKCEEKCDAGFP